MKGMIESLYIERGGRSTFPGCSFCSHVPGRLHSALPFHAKLFWRELASQFVDLLAQPWPNLDVSSILKLVIKELDVSSSR